MKITGIVLIALLGTAAAHTAEAAEAGTWTLGMNMGLDIVRAGGTATSFSVGSFAPGLRVGYAPPSGVFDVFVETSFDITHVTGSTTHDVLATANVQYNFSPNAVVTPYVTAGGGFRNGAALVPVYDPSTGNIIGFTTGTATDGTLGGGFGVRRKVGDGHGAIRAEARYDRLGFSGGANDFGLKLGFDLWIH